MDYSKIEIVVPNLFDFFFSWGT